MTKEWYRAHGFAVSANIEQEAIDAAERDIVAAYIQPILPGACKEDYEIIVANLAFLLLLQRSVKATRSGAKIKSSPNSQNAETWDVQSYARTAHLGLKRLREVDGANRDAKVEDICAIYFRTNFLNS